MEGSNNIIENETSKSNIMYYDSAAKYWSQIPPTIEGMLGGFGFISRTDIKGSQCFLKHLFKISDPPGKIRAADCGAGIGRVTKNLLIKYFEQVDLVEQNPTFLDEAKSFIGAKDKTVNCFNVGLQDFAPELDTYDVIWSQWVLGHLTDEDLVTFFKSCKRGLKPNGLIVVKENLTSSDVVEVDEQDSSVTRPLRLLVELYEQAGLECIHRQKQNNFPKGIYQVIMFALRPARLHATLASDSEECRKTSDVVFSRVTDINTIKHDIRNGGCPMLSAECMDQACETLLSEDARREHSNELSQEHSITGTAPSECIRKEHPTLHQECPTGMVLEEDILQQHPTVEHIQKEHKTGMLLVEDAQQECPTSMVLEDMLEEHPTRTLPTEHMQHELGTLPEEATHQELETHATLQEVESIQQKCKRAS